MSFAAEKKGKTGWEKNEIKWLIDDKIVNILKFPQIRVLNLKQHQLYLKSKHLFSKRWLEIVLQMNQRAFSKFFFITSSHPKHNYDLQF